MSKTCRSLLVKEVDPCEEGAKDLARGLTYAAREVELNAEQIDRCLGPGQHLDGSWESLWHLGPVLAAARRVGAGDVVRAALTTGLEAILARAFAELQVSVAALTVATDVDRLLAGEPVVFASGLGASEATALPRYALARLSGSAAFRGEIARPPPAGLAAWLGWQATWAVAAHDEAGQRAALPLANTLAWPPPGHADDPHGEATRARVAAIVAAHPHPPAAQAALRRWSQGNDRFLRIAAGACCLALGLTPIDEAEAAAFEHAATALAGRPCPSLEALTTELARRLRHAITGEVAAPADALGGIDWPVVPYRFDDEPVLPPGTFLGDAPLRILLVAAVGASERPLPERAIVFADEIDQAAATPGARAVLRHLLAFSPRSAYVLALSATAEELHEDVTTAADIGDTALARLLARAEHEEDKRLDLVVIDVELAPTARDAELVSGLAAWAARSATPVLFGVGPLLTLALVAAAAGHREPPADEGVRHLLALRDDPVSAWVALAPGRVRVRDENRDDEIGAAVALAGRIAESGSCAASFIGRHAGGALAEPRSPSARFEAIDAVARGEWYARVRAGLVPLCIAAGEGGAGTVPYFPAAPTFRRLELSPGARARAESPDVGAQLPWAMVTGRLLASLVPAWRQGGDATAREREARMALSPRLSTHRAPLSAKVFERRPLSSESRVQSVLDGHLSVRIIVQAVPLRRERWHPVLWAGRSVAAPGTPPIDVEAELLGRLAEEGDVGAVVRGWARQRRARWRPDAGTLCDALARRHLAALLRRAGTMVAEARIEDLPPLTDTGAVLLATAVLAELAAGLRRHDGESAPSLATLCRASVELLDWRGDPVAAAHAALGWVRAAAAVHRGGALRAVLELSAQALGCTLEPEAGLVVVPLGTEVGLLWWTPQRLLTAEGSPAEMGERAREVRAG